MSILGLCLIVLGTVFSFFGTYYSDKQGQEELTNKIQEKNQVIDNINLSNAKLIDQNSTLLNSNEDVSKSNQNLIGQNKDMLEKVGRYQADIEERNKTIELLQKEISNVKEYSNYAKMDIYGRDMIPGYGMKVSSDLIDRMTKILVEQNGSIYVKNDKRLLPEIDNVIRLYPNFPFGHWARFNLLKMLGDNRWKDSAKRAIDIFEITTTIEGHNRVHDNALKVLKSEMAANH
jgi:hypothetical protein